MDKINITLLSTDRIFVTLSQNGKEILNLSGSNFDGIPAVVRSVASAASGCKGMTTLRVRNISQGWSHSVPVMFTARRR